MKFDNKQRCHLAQFNNRKRQIWRENCC